MRTAAWQSLGQGIWRIDTAYLRPGVAACYLVQGGGSEYALIDCGTGLSVGPILRALEALGVGREQLRLVIPTHVHLDHAGGAGGLLAALPHAELHVHPRGARHLIDPSRLLAGARAVYGAAAFARDNGEILPAPATRTRASHDGQVLMLGDRPLELLDAPGHARHHLVVWDALSRGFFTGDVFGLSYPQLDAGGRSFILPTTTPVQFDPEAWQQTLERLVDYRPRRMYLTHYGRVQDVERLMPELSARIAEHAELARRHHAEGEAALVRRLGDAAWRDYRAQGGGLERADFDAILDMDLHLNAQGLLHWQQH